YRLSPPGFRSPKIVNLGALPVDQLVKNLESNNVWNRETAQRLIWERQQRAAIPALNQMLGSTQPLGRLHALYTLHGLGAVTEENLRQALGDADPRLRAHAIRLSEPRLKD